VPRPPLAVSLATISRLPRYARLTAGLLRDPEVPKRSKVALTAGLAYLLSPIDLVPGLIPVIGQLDDVLAVLLGVRLALAALPERVRADHLLRAGLTADQLDADLNVARQMLTWAAGSVLRRSVGLVGGVAGRVVDRGLRGLRG
jgi:uncharacterized membrane protein YkvA (DUF1232 family)